MKWQELSILVSSEYVEPISYLFGRYGRGLSAEDAGQGRVLLRTYLPNTSRRRMAHIEVGTKLVQVIEPLAKLTVREVEEADWESAWKDHFTLLNIGKRLVIKPSWISYGPAEGEVVIELDPGMAFGTGYHPTTKMVLEALEEEVRPGMRLLDLGTGSGILSIAAMHLGAASAVAMDIDPEAVRAARKNLREARLNDRITLVRGSLPHRAAVPESFDLAAANISKKTIEERGPALYETLKPGGKLIASGLLASQSDETGALLSGLGLVSERVSITDDWAAITLVKGG